MSFDVTTLVTNIPQEETINITIDTIFENNLNIKFTRKEIAKSKNSNISNICYFQ